MTSLGWHRLLCQMGRLGLQVGMDMARPRPGRVQSRIGAEPLGSDHLARKMPRTCPSPLLPTLGEGWLPLGLSPLLGGVGSSWENRLGAAPPLGRRGKHLAGSPGGRRQHRRTYLVPEPSRLLPARPPLPTLARLPWTGPPSPGPRPCGAPTRTTCRKSGEAHTWAQAVRPPGAGGLREEPGPLQSWALASRSLEPGRLGWLVHPGLQAPPGREGGPGCPSWKGVGCLGVPVPLGASVSLSVKGADKPAVSPS